uniref:Enoyl-CoA hydratase n=1 Tax=Spongospora subterranea TaxID=70186 RepID=A0A0H5QJA3_9EUKA|eukprot:CRZ02190.1 hypothetical protein [Spongospora subterranea]
MEFVDKFLPGAVPVAVEKDLTLLVEPGAIAWLVFNVQGRSVNVVNLGIVEQAFRILTEIERLMKTDSIKVLMICSGKPHTFIAGADIDEMYPNVNIQAATQASSSAQAIFHRISELPIISICCINGAALGAGLELALACDYRVCIDNDKVQLGLPEVKLGLLPGSGGTVRLPRLIGLNDALDLILTGKAINPAKALTLNLIDCRICSGPGQFDEPGFFLGARKFAVEKLNFGATRRHHVESIHSAKDYILNNTSIGRWAVLRKGVATLNQLTRGNYPAPYLALESAVHSLSVDIPTGLKYEAKLFGQLAVSPESKSLMAVYYLLESAKKVPKTLKAKAGLQQIRKIGIVGAGAMGSQLAAIAITRGFLVYIRDIASESLQNAAKFVDSKLESLVLKKRLTATEKQQKMASLRYGTAIEEFSDCDVVIEAAVEVMDIKKRILQEIEPVLSKHAIFATNTSSLSISTLAKSSSRRHQLCGMHFFNPIEKMPLVEVIKGPSTDSTCLSTIYKLALQLGKTPCICNDGPGFIANRVLGVYMNEAGRLAMEGNSIDTIDGLMVDFGMPMGPFRLIDEVGLDVVSHIGPSLASQLGPRFAQSPAFAQILNRDPTRLGKKSGSGFYVYDNSGKSTPRSLNQEMISEIKRIATVDVLGLCSKQDVVNRCILLSLQEACYILADGICSSAAELDLAMVFGTGFAPFRGGLLNYADQTGIVHIVSSLKALAGKFGARFDPHPMLLQMASKGTLFFPERPHGMMPVRNSSFPSKLSKL